jgi:hypothetical protein
MSPNQNHKEFPPNAGAVFATALLNAAGKQLPSSQETRGDDKLKKARDLVTTEVRTVTPENDLRIIEDKITLWVFLSLKCIAANVRQCPGDEGRAEHQIGFSKIPSRSGIP